MNCNKCGAIVAPGSTNCPNCGEAVVVPATPVSPVGAAPQAVVPSAPVEAPQAVMPSAPVETPQAVVPSAPVEAPQAVMPSAPVEAPQAVVPSAPVETPQAVMPSAPVEASQAVMPSAPAEAPQAVVPSAPVGAAPQVLQNALPVNGAPAPVAQVAEPMAQTPVEQQTPVQAASVPKKNNSLIIVIIVLLVLIGVAAGLYFSGILKIKTSVTVGTPTTNVNSTTSTSSSGTTTSVKTTTTEGNTTRYTTTTQANNLGANKQTVNGYTFTIPTTFTGTKDKNNGSQLWVKNDKTYLSKLVKIGSMSLKTITEEEIKTKYTTAGINPTVHFLSVDEMSAIAILYEMNGVVILDLYYEIENGLTVYMLANVYDITKVSSETVLRECGKIASSAEKVSGSFAAPGKMDFHDTEDLKLTNE